MSNSNAKLDDDSIHVDQPVLGADNTLRDPSYGDEQNIDLPKGAEQYEREDGSYINTPAQTGHKSLINKYNLLRLKTIDNENFPITDEESEPSRYEVVTGRTLIDTPKGASIYSPEDFIYCDKYNKLFADQMVTLRRFAYPVFDDIFTDIQGEPDIARLVGYSDDEINKPSEIMSFSFGVRWKELKAATEQARMEGDPNGVDGYMKSVLKYADPKFGQEAMLGKNALNYDPLHDSNKVYGPVDSITESHIRDVGLNFNHEFELKFVYDLSSRGGINPKASMLDILTNVFALGTNNAKFWGGARYWVGPRPTKYLNDLKFLSVRSFDEFMNKSQVSFKSMLSNFGGEGKNAKDTLTDVATNAANLGMGKLLDKIGRPGIPVMNSLLTGTPVGEWHVTIGNPLSPTMVMGNMLLDDTQVSFSDTLGYDGFPNKMYVTCKLKHAMPRSIAEMESMMNCGRGRIYMKPEQLFDNKQDVSTEQAPKSVWGYTKKAIDKTFGNFSETDVLRNSSKVWDFLKTDKI